MATPSPIQIRRHLKGEHNFWCSNRKGNLIVCKITGQTIKQVGA